jgi:radical SAM protein with 4Fe4S-binding SPASM domain
MWLELVSDCNLKCVMCPNKDLRQADRGIMAWPIFQQVVDQAADFVFDMSLHHRGESLLHPEALKCIAYAAQKISHTNLHTNGVLLNEEIARGVIEAGLKRISFSFDGFVKGDYEKIRVGARFEEVVGNIKTLLRLRSEAGRKFPKVAIEVIELSRTQVQNRHREKFIKDFKALGLDELVIKKPHNWAGYINTRYTKKTYAPCTFPWNAMLVLYNGDVVPCAQDFFAKQVIGNVAAKSLEEIWTDEPLRKLRQGLIEKRYCEFPACADCDRLWRDTVMGIPREYLKRLLLHKMP